MGPRYPYRHHDRQQRRQARIRANALQLGRAGPASLGDRQDNALAETINGLFKAGVSHRRGPWRSFEAVEYAALEWVDGFNNRRRLEPIGNIPRRSRSKLLPSTGTRTNGRAANANQPPEYPARFTAGYYSEDDDAA